METPSSEDRKPLEVNIRLHWATLRFLGQESILEKPFMENYFVKNLNHLRNCHLYSIFFYVVAGLIDYVIFPDKISELFIVRFLIVVPIFLAGYIYTFNSRYRRFWQQISFFYILVTGGSFIFFTAAATPPKSYDYYVGILFCLVFGYTLIRERFLYASVAGMSLVAAYIFNSLKITDMPCSVLFHSSFYLVIINFLGMLISRYLEISARRDFYLEERLAKERSNVIELNNELEIRVAERTDELEKSYLRLSREIMERKEVEKRLMHAHKMEAIGTLAGGIAHDFNNILSSIIGYTELSIDEMDKNSPIEANLHQIYFASIRARDLVKQILTFAHQSQEETRPVYVSPIVKEVLKLLRSSIPSTIEIESSINSRATIMGDPVSIHQILMNLCTNAAYSMEKGGKLGVKLDDFKQYATDNIDHDGLKPGSYIRLVISDTGSGIAPEVIDSIFEPYFTTKPLGEGTGMGLAMVHGIVKKYGGEIEVESKSGRGTIFSVFLPVTEESAEEKSYTRETLPVGDENILVVDDEPGIALMVKQALEKLGYSITVFTRSVDALDRFRKSPQDFDLVITDMTMPELTGDQLAVELIRIRPDIKVMLFTGYSRKISESIAREMGIKAFAYKPVIQSDLAKSVRRVLDGENGGETGDTMNNES